MNDEMFVFVLSRAFPDSIASSVQSKNNVAKNYVHDHLSVFGVVFNSASLVYVLLGNALRFNGQG